MALAGPVFRDKLGISFLLRSSLQSKVSQNQLIFVGNLCSSAYTSSRQSKSHSQSKQGCQGRGMNFWKFWLAELKTVAVTCQHWDGKCKSSSTFLTQTWGLSVYKLVMCGSTQAHADRTWLPLIELHCLGLTKGLGCRFFWDVHDDRTLHAIQDCKMLTLKELLGKQKQTKTHR